MALRLASTAANYFSYPSKTQDGGYRLGNVTVRNTEKYVDLQGREKTRGLVSHALRKPALIYKDYVSLTLDYFSGKIDTHEGYFSDGESDININRFLAPAIFPKGRAFGSSDSDRQQIIWLIRNQYH